MNSQPVTPVPPPRPTPPRPTPGEVEVPCLVGDRQGEE